jgi:hypothetical protein
MLTEHNLKISTKNGKIVVSNGDDINVSFKFISLKNHLCYVQLQQNEDFYIGSFALYSDGYLYRSFDEGDVIYLQSEKLNEALIELVQHFIKNKFV